MSKTIKTRISLLVCLFIVAALAVSSTLSFATEVENGDNVTTYPIYESLEEAEANLDNKAAVNLYYEDSRSGEMQPRSAKMYPFFVRSGNTTKVQMYLNYSGTKPASTLKIGIVEIWNDHLWPHPDREMLDVEMNIYSKVAAAKKVRFPAGTYIIPKADKKVRVDWDDAKVLVNDVGWVTASDPVGAYDAS